ncbi:MULTISPECIES: class I mannose-6-phosphate isomerase [Sphingobium]|uniref:Mannose-6-phosphate isomerase n=1 Tax=Sphingobium indicum (strain DSM 16413 / CCM 7287 / MTCC 6362 / UT26 / NBRC 101211 / UT26S) TaxID=452662 RepID=D4Z5G3_SPHIU|nr:MULTISPECIES: class I mannose-6-phosphate isomerase [Sphingobium]WDA38677.1 class I mannose-6-phosphate isomerase [Sphingobium sp. YC-XJ3]BAI97845.1 mannose-6-phosphate isomerase [Sphingobium indicum UT26S]
MPIHRLVAQVIEKPWGRTDIPSHVSANDGRRIGEVWFSSEQRIDLPLLVKYIFTSDNLSVQVHPNDEQAQQHGMAGGKSECWYVLDAAPDARLGIGMCQAVTSEQLRAAALDGSIETLMEWKPVKPGSFYYIPAGTVHAIGGGVALVEIQQNNNVTYRLYDYGRPRELHLDQAVAVSVAEPYSLPDRIIALTAEERLIGSAAPFTLDIVQGQAQTSQQIKGEMSWFIPLAGTGILNGESWRPGECWLIEGEATIEILEQMSALIAQPMSPIVQQIDVPSLPRKAVRG